MNDFAEVRNKDAWLRHPVLGDPSFDAFIRVPGNPIYRGAAPREWPVNGFLLEDPQGGGLLAYVGRYPRDYKIGPGHAPADCVVLRSQDDGHTWREIGPVFVGDFAFAGETGGANIAPDVSVVYADGRYHLAYDWVHDEVTWDTVFNPTPTCDSGVGYAWAERPEGPFHRHPRPIFRNISHCSPVPGKYRRLYASTLQRRRDDWLLLTLTDSGQHFAWGLYAMTAVSPEGPWSAPQLVQSLESDRFHPALMEFFPAFCHEGYVFAPATAVALNRNFQCLWRAPLESAHEPAAWNLHQHGSLWHSEMRVDEHDGIWGQTFSGLVNPAGKFLVLFPSRDPEGRGTINLAECAWAKTQRDQGFVFNGCTGPGLTLLRCSHGAFMLAAEIVLHGTARLLWGWRGVLGPDRYGSDASLHPLSLSSCRAWEFSAAGWRLLSFDENGTEEVMASGAERLVGFFRLGLDVVDTGRVSLSINGVSLWSGPAEVAAGSIGWFVGPHTRLEVTRFEVQGASEPVWMKWHCREAFLATGVLEAEWESKADAGSPGGTSALHRESSGRLKWNFYGTGVRWWAPRGPEQGRVRLKIDGEVRAEFDLHAPDHSSAAPVFVQEGLADGGHAIVIEAISGRLATGGLEVACTPGDG